MTTYLINIGVALTLHQPSHIDVYLVVQRTLVHHSHFFHSNVLLDLLQLLERFGVLVVFRDLMLMNQIAQVWEIRSMLLHVLLHSLINIIHAVSFGQLDGADSHVVSFRLLGFIDLFGARFGQWLRV